MQPNNNFLRQLKNIIRSATKKQPALLLYKLLHDALFLWLLFFTTTLIAENLLPGFLSAHLSFAKIIFLLFFLMIATSLIREKYNLIRQVDETKHHLQNKLLIISSVLLLLALVIISLRKFAIFEITIITAITFAIFYYFLKVFSEK